MTVVESRCVRIRLNKLISAKMPTTSGSSIKYTTTCTSICTDVRMLVTFFLNERLTEKTDKIARSWRLMDVTASIMTLAEVHSDEKKRKVTQLVPAPRTSVKTSCS